MSLRDVERAMIVFEYFYDKRNIFGPLVTDWVRKNCKEEDMPVTRTRTELDICETVNDLNKIVETPLNDLDKSVPLDQVHCTEYSSSTQVLHQQPRILLGNEVGENDGYEKKEVTKYHVWHINWFSSHWGGGTLYVDPNPMIQCKCYSLFSVHFSLKYSILVPFYYVSCMTHDISFTIFYYRR